MLPPNSGSRSPPSKSTLPMSRNEDLMSRDTMRAKHGASVLARKADFEGWSDNELTTALSRYPAKIIPLERKPAAATSAEESNARDAEQALRLKKRQEVVRVTRQADMEGWSDEKLVAALRLRNSIHYELRSRVPRIGNP